MTINDFFAILIENGYDPNLVRINDNAADNVFFINKNYYKYEVGYRERGIVFEPRSFSTEEEALRYLLKRIAGVGDKGTVSVKTKVSREVQGRCQGDGSRPLKK